MEGGPPKGILQGSDLPNDLPPFWTFWATKKAWARITVESRMFVRWNNDSNKEKKSNWDSNGL